MRWQMDLLSVSDKPIDSAQHAMLAARIEALAQEPLITLLNDTHDIDAAQSCVTHFKKRSDTTIVIGTGGASLGAQALLGVALASAPNPLRRNHAIEFVDNIDPATLARVFDGRDLTRLSWLMISKSGETVETLATILSVIGLYVRAGLLPELSSRAAVITGVQRSSLRELATQYGWQIFDHPEIGGRYSVFSLVGMLPAMLMGQDVRAIRQGATQWFVHMMGTALTNAGAAHPVIHSALWLYRTRKTQPIHVVMPYADSLRAYTRWFAQLWSESLGKGGDGSTPFAAIGSLDQHSQLQLFLDGPRDKSFTFVLPKRAHEGEKLSVVLSDSLSFLHDRTMGEVMDASADATVATLRTHRVPLRVLRTAQLDAFSIGELMLMQMVETILVGSLMNVNPYDQPAVEESKHLTRQMLRLKADA